MKRRQWKNRALAAVLCLGLAAGAAGCNEPKGLARLTGLSGLKYAGQCGSITLEMAEIKLVKCDEAAFEAQKQTVEENLALVNSVPEEEIQAMSQDEQDLYKMTKENLTRQRALYDYRLLWEPNCGIFGLHAELPLTLEQYEIVYEYDLENRIELTEEAAACLDSVLAFQQEKAAAGLFMEDAQADEVIQFCRNFAKEPESIYLIEDFNKKVDSMEESETFTAEDREKLKQTHKQAVTEKLAPAYLRLADGLEALKGKDQGGGLCKTEEGKAYYRALAAYRTGSDKTPEEMAAMLDEALKENDKAWNRALNKNGKLLEKTQKTKCNTKDPDALMEHLKQAYKTAFPAVEEPEFSLAEFDAQLANNGTGGLIYLNNHTIYLPDKDNLTESTLYFTLAHEGYPGHLYQSAYGKTLPYTELTDFLCFDGYTEGWAKYAELYSAKWAQDTEEEQAFMANEQLAIILMQARIDIGVNLEGWDKAKVKQILGKYNFYNRASDVQAYWNDATASPGGYLPYAIGYLELEALREQAQQALGEKYSDMGFHTAVMECGVSPFWRVKKHVERYIETTLHPQAEPEKTEEKTAA
ncbi:MAG: DUF885 domain-containing protein [Christensenellales bacterium]